jgi:hypothetical protein
MIRLATETDATFAPYSNICPISGWTGADIEQTGKNLCHPHTESTNIYNGGFLIPVRQGETIYAYGEWEYTSSASLYIKVFDAPNPINKNDSGTEIGSISTNTVFSRVMPCDGYLGVCYRAGVSTYTIDKMMVSRSVITSASDYEPYQSNQISVNWEDEAGTVYGGTLDVVSRKMEVDRAGANLTGVESWSFYRSDGTGEYTTFQCRPFSVKVKEAWGNNTKNNAISSIANVSGEKVYNVNGAAFAIDAENNVMVCIPTSNANSVAAFKAYLEQNPIQIVGRLVTPIVYTLTESEISSVLETLYGTNNIWADTGDTEVTYPCDTRLFIEGKIAEAVANVMNS